MSATESKAEFARRLGVHRGTITRAAQAGRLVLDHKGRVLVEESLQRWHATKGHRTDMQAEHAAKRGQGIPKAQADATTQPEEAQEGAQGGETGRTQYKAISLHYENSLIKLEMALRRRQRYALESIQREAHAMGNTVRAAVERMIDETAPRLAMISDPQARRAILLQETKRITRLVKQEQVRALRRLRNNRGSQS